MKIKFNIPYKKIIKYSFFVIIICGFTAVFFTMQFLYQYFFPSLNESSSLIDLHSKVAIESINIKKFDSIIKQLELKKSIPPPIDINNLFN